MKKDSDQFKMYNKLVHPTRISFMKSSGINVFMCESNPKKMLAFLLIWTASSIKMTEKVESWIQRAGESCDKLNFIEVGSKLKYHSQQEANHEKMLIDDVNYLINMWNSKYSDNLKLDDLLKLGTLSETQNYVDLHENVIKSEHPYTQTAIEYEIERISVVYGPRMIENIINTLGEEFELGITFLAEHVLLDQGHTKFNIDLMEKCLTAKADLNQLALTGISALKIYSGFLDQCSLLSFSIFGRDQWNSQLTT